MVKNASLVTKLLPARSDSLVPLLPARSDYQLALSDENARLLPARSDTYYYNHCCWLRGAVVDING